MTAYYPEGQQRWLDMPEKYPLIGEITEVYSIIDNALDNGHLSLRTLSDARSVAEEVLLRYEQGHAMWQVFADITDETHSELHDVYAGDYPDCFPRNIIGDVADVELYDIGSDSGAKLGLVIESNGLGHFDRYKVPIAIEGDGMIRKSRPVDMPEMIRQPYQKRMSPNEVFIASDFSEYITREGVSEYDLARFFEGSTNNATPEVIQEYFVALNLELEDAYDEGDAYTAAVNSATVEVLYDHTYPKSGKYIDSLTNEQWCDVIRIDYMVNEHEKLENVSLIVVTMDNDRLIRIPLEGSTDLTLFKPGSNE